MFERQLTHNYVIAGSTGYSKVGYYDLTSMDGVCYFHSMKEGITSRFDLILQRLTFSEKVNKVFSFPFAHHTFSHLYPFSFKKQKPLVFLFFGQNQTVYQSGYIDYIREKYPGVRVVLYMIDLISRNKKLDFPKARSLFDLIISYDKGDCKEFGLEYFPTSYSHYPVPDNPSIESIDVFYCGNAKMRGDIIFDTYRQCIELGLKCLFFVTDVPKEMRIDSDDIIYDHYIDYVENLQYVKKAKCILEVMQTKADGFTPRLWESIMYDRHLLTNNTMLAETSYYIPSSMHDLNSIANIKDWIDKPLAFDESIKASLSPIHLLYFIDDKLKQLNKL